MKIAVILGNRLNDDGSITEIMRARLQLAYQLDKQLCPDKIIVSGGVANPTAGKSEAEVMKTLLIEQGVDGEKIILEDQSMTTMENAKFSVPIAAKLGASEIIVCTTPEHMHRWYLNPKNLFKKHTRKYKIALSTCCTTEEIEKLK